MSVVLSNPGDAAHIITSVAGGNIVVSGAGNSVNPGTSGGTPIAYVTSLSAATPTRQVVNTTGAPSAVVAKIPMSYNAPVPLGTGSFKFSGVQYVIDDGTKLTKLTVFPFGGVGGGPETDYVLSTPLLWPDAVTTWTVYAVSVSTTGGATNDLIKVGNPNATPNVSVTVGGAGPAPDVAFFLAGKESSTGQWTSVMYWNATNTEMRIDWAITAPADTSNFYGVKIWINAGTTPYSAATGIIKLSDFLTAQDGVTRYIRDTISFALNTVPSTSQQWQFIAESFNTANPPVGNLSAGQPSGPTVWLATLNPANIPNFNPPGKVLNADWTAVSDPTPNKVDVLVTYTPPVQSDTLGQGPFQGVDIFLLESGPGIISGGGHDTGTAGYRGNGTFVGSFDSDGTSNPQSLTFMRAAALGSGQTWTMTVRPYGANQSGANSNTGLQTNDVTIAHSAPLYAGSAQIATNVTASMFPTYDQAGNPTFGLQGTFPIPNDPLFAFCRITAMWDGNTAETVQAEQSDGEFLTDAQNAFPDQPTNLVIRFYAVNQMNQQNMTNPPSVRIPIARPMGPLGAEWVPVVTNPYANVITSTNESGGELYSIQGGWSLPVGGTGRQHRGVVAILRVAGQRDVPLFQVNANTAIGASPTYSKPPTVVNGTVYFLSVDANNRANSIQDGTGGTTATPSASVTIAPSASGTLLISRARPDQFGTGIKNTGSQVIVDQLPGFALQAFTIGQGQLQQLQVIDTPRIVDGAIAQIKLQNAPIIDGFRMQDLIVTNAKLAYAAIDFFNVKNGAIQNAQLAFASVGTAQLQNLAVNGFSHIQQLTVGPLQLGQPGVGTNNLFDLSVTSAKILNLSADKLDVSRFIQVGGSAMTTNGQSGIAIINGGGLAVLVGDVFFGGRVTLGGYLPWKILGGPFGSIIGNGYVNANNGFYVNGVPGITTVKVVGSNTFYLQGGIITAIT